MGLTTNDKLERISKAVVMIYFKSMQCVSGLRFKYRDTPSVHHVSITQLFSSAVPSAQMHILCKTSNMHEQQAKTIHTLSVSGWCIAASWQPLII